jgi:diacylglycerol kinase family enzyme
MLSSRAVHGSVVVSERRGHIRQLAAEAIRTGSQRVLVWGGDGSVNEAGTALMGGTTPLGMIRGGSGNGLARELGVPADPRQAIAAALEAKPRLIDAGELGGRLFFNLAGIGFDAYVAARFDSAATRGLTEYVRISTGALLSYRCSRYRITAGHTRGSEEVHGRGALLVTVANSPQFGNGAIIAPAARVDDGLLDLVIYEERSRLATVCAVPRLFTGGIGAVRGFRTRRIERARIESDAPLTFHVDGEPVSGGTTLDVRVLPHALSVCV